MPKRSIDRIHAYNIVTPALLDCVLGTQQLCGTVSFGTSGTTENSGFSGSSTLFRHFFRDFLKISINRNKKLNFQSTYYSEELDSS